MVLNDRFDFTGDLHMYQNTIKEFKRTDLICTTAFILKG